MMLLSVSLLLFNSSENAVTKLGWPEFSSALYKVTTICIPSAHCTLMGRQHPMTKNRHLLLFGFKYL
jgi:hypothetical protein